MLEKKSDESDQRVMIAILLCVMVFWVWSSVFSPPSAPTEELDPVTTGAGPDGPGPDAVGVPSGPAQVAADPVAVPEREVPLSTAELNATLSSRNGALHSVTLPRHLAPLEVTPIWRGLWGMVTGGPSLGEWRPYGDDPGVERLLTDQAALLHAGAGEVRETPHRVDGDGALRAAALYGAVEVSKTLATTEDARVLRVSVSFTNTGTSPWSGPLWVGANDWMNLDSGSYVNVARPSAVVDGDLETLLDLGDADEGPVSYEGPVSWMGIGDRYFLAAMAPDQPEWGGLSFQRVGEDRYGAYLVRQATLQPGQSEQLSFDVYIGTKDLDVLEAQGHDLEVSVDLGMFGFFARPLLFVLKLIHGVVGNWGWSIILLTLLVKALFWPLNRASFASSRKMQALQPRLEEIRQKYKDDAQKAGQEQMQLFQKEGVNPLSGCLPMLVQMPVWFALYSVLLYSSDVYHADFFYLQDLSSLDPLGLLPTLMGGLMVLQQSLTPMPPSMDPVQQRILKLMPLMFAVVMYTFPSGLALYSLVNTVLSILQMWLINRTIPAVMPPAGAR